MAKSVIRSGSRWRSVAIEPVEAMSWPKVTLLRYAI
jgi:hypothetical protein